MNEAKAAVLSTILCSIQLPQPPSSPTKTCGWDRDGGNEEGSRERRKEREGSGGGGGGRGGGQMVLY